MLAAGETSLALVPLFAAHRVIIDAVAATPLHAYRTVQGIREKLPQQPEVFGGGPYGTSFNWKSQCIASLLADGNAFGLVAGRTALGWPSQIVWLDPAEVHVDDTNFGSPRYFWQGRPLAAEQLVHIPWITTPGKVRGISPLKNFKIAFELGQAAQKSARDWFAGGTTPRYATTTRRASAWRS